MIVASRTSSTQTLPPTMSPPSATMPTIERGRSSLLNEPFAFGFVTVLLYFSTPGRRERPCASPPTVAAVARPIQLNDCGTASSTEYVWRTLFGYTPSLPTPSTFSGVAVTCDRLTVRGRR